MKRRDPGPQVPTLTLCAAEIVGVLRAAVDLPPLEDCATVDRTQVTIDAEAWAEWCLAGLSVFAGSFPTMARVRHESRRVVVGLAMLRARGNVSKAARILAMSRKALRDSLRAVGLYPWRRGAVHAPAFASGLEVSADVCPDDGGDHGPSRDEGNT